MKLGFKIDWSSGRPRGIVSIFRRDERGATAVEFGLVAIPFFMLLAAIIEIAMMFWTTQVLEEALSQTARTLLTGQSQDIYKSGSAADKMQLFKTNVCNNAAFPLISCDKLFVDVKTYTTFGNASSGTSSPVSGGAMNTSSFSFNQPQAGQIVVVRAALEYPLFFTEWSKALANIGTGKRGIIATAAFKAEPFSGAGS